MHKFFGLLLALMLGCVMPTHAQYSQNPDADYIQINAEVWLFCPATDSSEVKGFLALLDSADSAGLNIQLIWYQAEADGSWTSWGWEEPDLSGAVWWVRSHLNDPLAFTPDIDLHEAAETVGPEAAMPPAPLVNGLFIDDPFQPVVQEAEDATLVVDTLATAGWQITPAMSSVEVGESNPCGQESADALQCLLDDLASDVEVAYFGFSSRGIGYVWPCKCTKTWDPIVYGPWVLVDSYVKGTTKYCKWERTRSRDWTKTSKTFWFCEICDATGTKPYTKQKKTTTVYHTDPCEEPIDE